MKRKTDDFLSGVFSVMQYLVLDVDQPTLAAEIAKEHGITQGWALQESRRTGLEVRKMNRFIRRDMTSM